MNLNEIRFKAVEGKPNDCTGCMFAKEPASICQQVSQKALELRIPNCAGIFGQDYIYVPDDSDPRQIALDGRGEVVG